MRQLYPLISLRILQIRINKTELNKEKKGKHSGITVCSDSYKNEKKKLNLVDIKEKWCLTFSNPSGRPGGGGGGVGGYCHIWAI